MASTLHSGARLARPGFLARLGKRWPLLLVGSALCAQLARADATLVA